MRRLQALLTLTWMTASPAVAQTSPTLVPLAIGSDGTLSVEARIGRAGPFRFLLDTGANLSAVTESVAARLELEPVARTLVTSPTGSQFRPIVRVGGLSIDGTSSSGISAAVLPDDVLHARHQSLDGILGMDFLGERDFTIDYRRRQLLWNDRGDPANATSTGVVRLALASQEGRPLVTVPRGDGSTTPLVFAADSGAAALVLFERPDGAALGMDARDTMIAHGSSGPMKVKTTIVRELRIGPLVFQRQLVVLVPDRQDDIDGLLPLHSFRRVSFRVQDGYLELER